MAQKRMFSMKITDSDAFLDMPLSSQCLYFHLNMHADDDGFIGNPKKIARMIGASSDDLKILVAKRFILVFEDGVVVVKHWRIHNTLKSDRYQPTVYTDELGQLSIKENKAYTMDKSKEFYEIQNGSKMVPKRFQNGTTDIGIGLGIDKDIKEKCIKEKPTRTRFVKPTLDDVISYCKENNYGIDCERFIDYYESNGWRVGKNPMKDWKAAVRSWDRKDKSEGKTQQQPVVLDDKFYEHKVEKSKEEQEKEMLELQEKLRNGTL